MTRFSKTLFFVCLSLGFHLLVFIVDFSDPPELSAVQQLGVAFFPRSSADFKPSGQTLVQATTTSPPKPIVQQVPQVKKPKSLSAATQAPLSKQADIPEIQEKEPLKPALLTGDVEPPSKQKFDRPESLPEVATLDSMAGTTQKSTDGEVGANSSQFDNDQGLAMIAEKDASTPSANQGFQDALPRYELNPSPKYPEVARRRSHEGTVLLSVSILADGQVEDASLLESSGHQSLDHAALRAVRRWEFKPATSFGSPVASRVNIPIDFVLSEN